MSTPEHYDHMSLSDFHAFPLMPDPTCIVVARVIVQVSRSKETSRPMIFAPTPENVQGNSVSPETRKVRLEHDPRLAFLSPLSTPPPVPDDGVGRRPQHGLGGCSRQPATAHSLQPPRRFTFLPSGE